MLLSCHRRRRAVSVTAALRHVSLLQLEKVYDPKNEEDDMMEMEEERLRMREHVMKNVSLF